MNAVIQVKNLKKTYGAVKAVDDISFEVMEGEIFGIVGPNGAGKTTTIECLEGLRKPDSGEIRVLGVDPQMEKKAQKILTGMQLQQSNLPDRMKVWEALDLYSSFYPNPINWEELLSQLGLAEKRNTIFSKLSGGQKQRLFVALALVPDPKVIFLDELTTGLDPQARHTIWGLIQEVQAQGKTIILSTHFMEEAERLCDRVAILDHGKIMALNSPSELIRMLGKGERINFRIEGEVPPIFDGMQIEWNRIDNKDKSITIYGNQNNPSFIIDVVSLLVNQKIPFRDLRIESANLEDVFLNLTGTQIRE